MRELSRSRCLLRSNQPSNSNLLIQIFFVFVKRPLSIFSSVSITMVLMAMRRRMSFGYNDGHANRQRRVKDQHVRQKNSWKLACSLPKASLQIWMSTGGVYAFTNSVSHHRYYRGNQRIVHKLPFRSTSNSLSTLTCRLSVETPYDSNFDNNLETDFGGNNPSIPSYENIKIDDVLILERLHGNINDDSVQFLLQQYQKEINALNDGVYLNVNSPKQVAKALFRADVNNEGKTPSTNRYVLEQAALGNWPNLRNTNTSPRLAKLVLLYRSTAATSGSLKAETASVSNLPENNITSIDKLQSTTVIPATRPSLGSNDGAMIGDQDGIVLPSTDISNESTMRTALSLVSDEYKETETPDSTIGTFDCPTEWDRNDDDSKYKRLVDSLFSTSTSNKNHRSNTSNKVNIYWKEHILELTRKTAMSLVSQLDFHQCPMGFDPLAQPFVNNDKIGGVISDEVIDDDIDDWEDGNDSEDAAKSSGNVRSSVTGSYRKTTVTTAGKKGSLLSFYREQKEKHPECIILMRCGDFYETYGIDAILLVEHCGLNPMGGKAKAGFPIRNIQSVLNSLTELGFRAAVYEEGADTDSLTGTGASGGSKARIKSRFLAQIISSASPSYLYGLVLAGTSNSINGRYSPPTSDLLSSTAPQARPYVGVLSMQTGYTMVEVSAEERTVRVSERLTPEAVACRLSAYPPADPLLYIPSWAEHEHSHSKNMDGGSSISSTLPFLPSRRDCARSGPGSRIRTKIIPPTIVQGPTPSVGEQVRAKHIILSELLKMSETLCDDDLAIGSDDASSSLSSKIENRRSLTVDDFTLVSTYNVSNVNSTHTNPLHPETARQLGLMNDDTIPSLISYILPESAPAATRRFLRRYLLTPPPLDVADAMSNLIAFFSDGSRSPSIPPLSIPPVGKVLAMIRAGQASAEVYGELLRALSTTATVLQLYSKTEMNGKDSVICSLMALLEYESGIAANAESLRRRCIDAIRKIEEVICPLHHVKYLRSDASDNELSEIEHISHTGPIIPKAFLERNEAIWRYRVRQTAIPEAYQRVQKASNRLADAVAKDFWLLDSNDSEVNNSGKSPVIHDIFNNLLLIKTIPIGLDEASKSVYFHPTDRRGKILRTRYTTKEVQTALTEYVEACDYATQQVSVALIDLSRKLHDEGHLPAIVQASHTNLILSASFFHAAKAKSVGWHSAEMLECKDDTSVGEFRGLWPYWMDQADSAPNMSGKSTLMRSTAAACLLTACGLRAPLSKGSKIMRFDHLFVRGASSDVPIEKKSAFGAEMEDVASLLRCCGSKSLVFVDELGRGTSPFDGTRLSAAILEAMAQAGMTGIFATHLHEIFSLPDLVLDRITPKRMAVQGFSDSDSFVGSPSWTYRLEDGICFDSMALVTASQFGIPKEVIARANVLSSQITSQPDNPFLLFSSVVNSDVENIDSQIASTVEDLTSLKSVSIPAYWSVPASLEGKSCVYVLRLSSDPVSIYIGESDNLRKRIKQHRSKGGSWKDLETVAVVQASGKTEARKWETSLIQNFAAMGLNVISTTDGRR